MEFSLQVSQSEGVYEMPAIREEYKEIKVQCMAFLLQHCSCASIPFLPCNFIEFTDCVKEKLRKNCTLATPSARYVRHLDRDGNFLQPPISFQCSKFRLHHSSQGRRESSGSPSGF
jgi:hypothetical protein